MTQAGDRDRIMRLLDQLDMQRSVRDLRLFGVRQTGSVWVAHLLTRTAAIEVQLLVYPFYLDPVLVVDYGEQLSLLESLAAAEAKWQDAPCLVASGKNEELGLIMTASATDVRVLAQERAQAASTDQPLWRYDAQLNRVIGGDDFTQLNGMWTRRCIVSLRHGQELIELLQRVEPVYAARTGKGAPAHILPTPYALLTVEQEPPAHAPSEFQEIAILVLAISDPEAISDQPGDIAVEERARAATNLLRLTSAAHAAEVSLRNKASDCFGAERVTRMGGLLDVYFMSQAPSERGSRRQVFQDDVARALETVLYGADSVELRTAILTAGVRQFVGDANYSASLADDVRRAAVLLTEAGLRLKRPIWQLAARITAG